MSNLCKISIIMTSYNKPRYVGRALEGILNQTFTDFEVFLMDDNSDEATQEVIRTYLSDSRIKFFRSSVSSIAERAERIRYATLINQALTMAKGEYITYATDDNVFRPQRLERMKQRLDQDHNINIVYSSANVVYINEKGQIIRSMERIANRVTWVAPCEVDHCSIMHRASILPIIHAKWGSYWDEDPQFYLRGDARFFWRLNHFWPFHPIEEVLDDNYITDDSLHTKVSAQEKSELVLRLPAQRTCKELRDHLRKLRSEG